MKLPHFSHSKLTPFYIIGYFVVIESFLIAHGKSLTPDQFFYLAIPLIFFLKRLKRFLMDWTVPISLIVLYDYLRGIMPRLTDLPHVSPMINFGKTMHLIGPVRLQSLLYSIEQIHWYDYLAVIVYMMHFVMPLLIALLFWIFDREKYKQFMSALLLLTYLGLITYLIIPTMPPWMAALQGYIPHLEDIMNEVQKN